MPAPDADRVVLSLFEGAGLLPGAQSPTWLARDTATGSSVVVKRLFSGAARGRVTQTLSLSHPNVVRTRRWFAAHDFVYVVRDVVRGRNLKQQLARIGNRHSAELLEKLLLPVLSALEAAHGAGIAHGGVCAENVLIADDGRVFVSDFAVSDPASKTNAPLYGGTVSVAGDIKAAGALITRHLPVGGAFAADAVRARVAGILARCDSLSDLRETLAALDKLATAPVPQARAQPVAQMSAWVGPPPLPEPDADGSTEKPARLTIDEPATNPASWATKRPVPSAPDPPRQSGVARLSWRGTEPGGVHVSSGGGGPATLILTNDGDATLSVRMVATQRPWLQVRQMELPIRLPGGASVPLDFSITARTLSPGEYKSEIYLSASAGGANAEDLRSGWFKHTAELRVIVVGDGLLRTAGEKPPYPSNAPTIPAPPGCAILLLCGGIGSGILLGLRLLL